MQNNYQMPIKTYPSTASTTMAITPPVTSDGLPKSSKPETPAYQLWSHIKVAKWRLHNLLKTTLPNICRSTLLALLNWASPERRSLNANPNRPVPVYDIINAGPRHRFATANFIAHNCLGLGYGAGPERFREFSKNFGIHYTQAEAEKAVAKFRTSNPKIVNYWAEVQTDMIKFRDQKYNKKPKPWEVQLFSGRTLYWFDIAKESWDTIDGKSRTGYRATTERGNKVRETIWGSKLTENIIQALARDVFAECLLRVKRAGIRVLFTVHDEMVCQVPVSEVENAMVTIRKSMTDPMPFMPELPLDADIHAADYYDK